MQITLRQQDNLHADRSELVEFKGLGGGLLGWFWAAGRDTWLSLHTALPLASQNYKLTVAESARTAAMMTKADAVEFALEILKRAGAQRGRCDMYGEWYEDTEEDYVRLPRA